MKNFIYYIIVGVPLAIIMLLICGGIIKLIIAFFHHLEHKAHENWLKNATPEERAAEACRKLANFYRNQR